MTDDADRRAIRAWGRAMIALANLCGIAGALINSVWFVGALFFGIWGVIYLAVEHVTRQKIDWHRAELTPNYDRRQTRRRAYDTKYGMCPHGTHLVDQCDGDDLP